MAFTQVQVTGIVTGPDNQPVAGAFVQWSLTNTIFDKATGVFATNAPRSATTVADGSWSITLDATDDPTTEPQGQAYRVEIQVPSTSLGGVNAAGSYFPVYYVSLPASAAPTVSLAQLIQGYFGIDAHHAFALSHVLVHILRGEIHHPTESR